MDMRGIRSGTILCRVIAGLMLGCSTAHAQILSLFDVPPSIGHAVEPNLVVTFDNSQSMYRGYVPDSISQDSALRAAKSSVYNKLYYDPAQTYLPPLDEDGQPFPPANFFAALTNPFNGARIDTVTPSSSVSGDDGSLMRLLPVRHTIDLSSEYVVRWNAGAGADVDLSAPGVSLLADEVSLSDEDRSKAYYFVLDNTLAGCAIDDPRDNDCYNVVHVSASSGPSRARPELGLNEHGDVLVSRDERQNFANWYQYYSLRVLVAKSVLGNAFTSENIAGGVRIARQNLSERGPQSGSVAAPINQPSLLTDDRHNFYEWIFNQRMGGDSPLRASAIAVGNFYNRPIPAEIGPYHERPWNPRNPGRAQSCRSNYHLMVTDGLWSKEQILPAFGNENADAVAAGLPDGVAYSASSLLYRHDQPRTLADIAFHYWATDLSPLRNDVDPVFRRGERDDAASYWDYRNDPATWQHVVQFALSIASGGDVPADGSPLEAMLAGTPFVNNEGRSQSGWSDVDEASFSDSRKIDDLYHAAVNSRGGFFTAQKPDELLRALNSITMSVGGERISYSRTAVNTASVSSDAMLFRAEYNGTTRAGDLKAFRLATGLPDAPCEGPAGTVCSSPEWQLNDGGYHGAPRVYSYNPDAGAGSRGIEFVPASVTAAMRDLLRLPLEPDAVVDGRINYLRGDDAMESAHGGIFRDRSPEQRTLGSVINSAPVFVGNGLNASGSREVDYPDASYREFLLETSDRTPMVYVGSNDGKLHAINATNGNPVFDYVPHALLSSLKWFSQPDFREAPGVDGLIATADVFINDRWRTVLIGGMRTGAKAYYALDITDPASASATSKVLWEITPDTPGAAELGFSYSRPVIVKSNAVASGDDEPRWVAIFGNGYNSSGGEAVLIIVDIETGDVLRSITTKSMVDTAGPFVPNGLNTPAAVFADSNFTADYVYAGDLRGNLWKFDLSSGNPDDWKVAYGTALGSPDSPSYDPEPLFIAKDADENAQPITATPAVGGHPQGRDGLMVYMGTGKYLERSDSFSTAPQSFYAIWDKDLCEGADGLTACIAIPGGPSKHHRAFEIDRDHLLAQSITEQTTDLRRVSDNSIDWTRHSGWYMDFSARGDLPAERVIAPPRLRSGLVLFSTFIPPVDACEDLGGGWLMALSRVNGGVPDHEPFISNRSGDVDGGGVTPPPSSGLSVDAQLLEVSLMGCGDRSCIVADEEGNMEQIDEGMHWGRWQWQMLQGTGE